MARGVARYSSPFRWRPRPRPGEVSAPVHCHQSQHGGTQRCIGTDTLPPRRLSTYRNVEVHQFHSGRTVQGVGRTSTAYFLSGAAAYAHKRNARNRWKSSAVFMAAWLHGKTPRTRRWCGKPAQQNAPLAWQHGPRITEVREAVRRTHLAGEQRRERRCSCVPLCMPPPGKWFHCHTRVVAK